MAESSIIALVYTCAALGQTLAAELPTRKQGLVNKIPDRLEFIFSEQANRLVWWAIESDANKIGTNSLEYRLRNCSDAREQIVSSLLTIKRRLEKALDILRRKSIPWDELPEYADFEEMLSNVECDEDLGEKLDFPKTELEQISRGCLIHVDLLFRITSAKYFPSDRLFASARNPLEDQESVLSDYIQSTFPGIEPWLADRLAGRTNESRGYFIYHAEKNSRAKNEMLGQGESTSSGVEFFPSAKDFESKKDHISKTFPASAHRYTLERPFPSRPQEADKGPFSCPFCFTMIDAPTNGTWKRHVCEDLKPYVCLEKDCPEEYGKYAQRLQWVQHMDTMHCVTYDCPAECGEKFKLSVDCLEHLESAHEGVFPPSELWSIVKRCCTRTDEYPDLTCPLCGEVQQSTTHYQFHVWAHMEQISMIALPVLDPDTTPK